MKRFNCVSETRDLIVVELANVEIRIRKDSGKIFVIPRCKTKERTHDKILRELANSLVNKGIQKIRVDLRDYEFNDPSLRLTCGKRRYDLVFYYRGKCYQCELKPPGKSWEARTWEQLRDMNLTAENLILIVPEDEVETAREIKRDEKKLWDMTIYSREELLKRISEGRSL